MPGANGPIAFLTNRDPDLSNPPLRNPEVYVMNADGTNPVNLSNNPSLDRFAEWSPDGTDRV